MTIIKAVIFDCDGTLVDSESISIQVLVDQIAELGLQLDYQQAVHRYSGNDLAVVLREIESQLGRSLPAAFLDDFRSRQIEVLKEDLLPIDGAADLLAEIRHPTCVASNAPQQKIGVCLETTGLDRFFAPHEIFSAYQIQTWKPAPDLFLLAAETLGVPPEHCAVVEDSGFGIEAGLAAGMQVCALDPHGHHAPWAAQGVTLVRSLRDLAPVLGGS